MLAAMLALPCLGLVYLRKSAELAAFVFGFRLCIFITHWRIFFLQHFLLLLASAAALILVRARWLPWDCWGITSRRILRCLFLYFAISSSLYNDYDD